MFDLLFIVCIYAFKYIRENNFIKYLLMILLATSIHVSSVMFLPFYFFINKPLKKLFIILCCFSILLYFSNLKFLNDLFFLIGLYTGEGKIDQVMNSYVESQSGGGFTLGFVFRLVLMSAMLYKYDTLSQKNTILLNVTFFYLISFTAFNSVLIMRDRFGQLFALGASCFLPFLFHSIEHPQRRFNYIITCMLFLFGQVYVQHNNLAAKYENVITGISDRQSAEIRIFDAASEYN